ncbi:MAG TPA: methyltransferase domain-containing protein [Acidimicrobiia bacterium]
MEYGRSAYLHDGDVPYGRNDYWLDYFGQIARRVVTDIQPESVLDAGCAHGMLVEKLRALNVDAYGVDASEDAIAAVHNSVRDYTWRGSLTDPLERKYDLVVCIELLEHMSPADAEQAIENMCAASDRVLFSSSPLDYTEPTHVNVHAPEDWSAQFARHGFVRNVEFDASFITPWTALYERSHTLLPEVVRSYDRAWWQLRSEVRQVREKLLELDAQLEEGAGPVAEENLRLHESLLASRDELVGHEARLGEALGRIEVLESELRRREDALADAQRLLGSRTGRALRAWHRIRALLAR